MSAPHTVTAIVVSYNTRDDTLLCLRSLREEGGTPLPIVVVDNGSTDGTPEALRSAFPDVVVIALETNCGFGAANNAGLARVATDYVLLINSDARLCEGALPTLVQHLDAHPDVGIVGPKTLNEDGTVQLSWGPDLGLWSEWRQRSRMRAIEAGNPRALRRLERECRKVANPDWVSGSCLAARAGAMRGLEGFDEGFFLYEEDADLCRRAREQGWKIALDTAAVVVHRRGRSMRQAPARAILEYHRSHLRYYRKHLPPWESFVLRAWMALRASVAWQAARRAGDAPRRGAWASVLALALHPGRP